MKHVARQCGMTLKRRSPGRKRSSLRQVKENYVQPSGEKGDHQREVVRREVREDRSIAFFTAEVWWVRAVGSFLLQGDVGEESSPSVSVILSRIRSTRPRQYSPNR